MIFARRIQPDEWVHSSPGFRMNGTFICAITLIMEPDRWLVMLVGS